MLYRPDTADLFVQLEHLEAELEMTAAAVPTSTRVFRLRDRVRRVRAAIDALLPPRREA